MTWTYVTNYDDFAAAQRLALKRHRFGPVWYYLWIWILPVAGTASLLVLLRDTIWGHYSLPPIVGAGLAMVAWCGLWSVVYRPFQWRRGFRQMKNGRPDSQPVELELTETELISRIPGVSEGRFFPNAVVRFEEDEQVALLYFAKKRFLLIPIRALGERDWEVLRSWIGDKDRGKD